MPLEWLAGGLVLILGILLDWCHEDGAPGMDVRWQQPNLIL